MKKDNSRWLQLFSAAVMVAFVFSPVVAQGAQERPIRKITDDNRPGGDFCAYVESHISNLEKRMYGHDSQINGKREQRRGNINTRRVGRDEKLTDKRLEHDQKRENRYEELEQRASTDEQKFAVVTFQNAVEDAVKMRKTAIDQAIDAYRAGLDELIAERNEATSAAVQEYRNAVVAAGTQAKSACSSGVDAPVARQNYIALLKAAREKLRIAHKSIESIGEKIQPLREAHKRDTQTALNAFQESLRQAKEDLKLAFAKDA
ncbi:hypothetical protein H6758_04305 [Candidatus Nomurabacteria bacterium]|nr:hypothetical protein [Candidatus Nomurabacteria bacterium]